jgi:hypothetical protein
VHVLVLAAKALIAVMLLVAGSAKLADVAGFGAAVRLLLPLRARSAAVTAMALAAAVTELGLGAASLVLPAVGWLNPVAFGLACGFVFVSGLGYVRHRGRSCRCFGALSSRRFDALAIARSMAIAVVAAAAMAKVPPALVDIGVGARVLLFGSVALVALASYSAAHALGLARRLELEAS